MPRIFLLTIIIGMSISSAYAQRGKLLWPEKKLKVHIAEPSDIAIVPGNNRTFVVSDNGQLYEMDSNGHVMHKAEVEGVDFEGVTYHNGKIYVSEESFRKILEFDTNGLKNTAVYEYTYSGGRNDGVEAITFNEAKNRFILITEKSPCMLFETDEHFQVINTVTLPKEISEVSAVCYHNGYLYVLGDEQHAVFKLNPNDYSLIQSWNIGITNPEGIAFNSNNELIIVSDDRAMQFTFTKIQ